MDSNRNLTVYIYHIMKSCMHLTYTPTALAFNVSNVPWTKYQATVIKDTSGLHSSGNVRNESQRATCEYARDHGTGPYKKIRGKWPHCDIGDETLESSMDLRTTC